MKELAAVDTRQGTALIEGGFKVYPQKILYSLPDREQYLYFKLILLSVYAPVRLRATDYVLQPGQYLTTYSKLAVATRVTRKQSISDIRKLIKRGLIACERHNGLLLITVLKYKEMQDLRNYSCYNNSTISNEGTPQGTPTEKNGHTKPLKTKGEPRKSGTPTEKNGHTSGQQKYSYLKEHQKNTPLPPKGDCEKFVTLWNEICGEKLPKVRELTDNRKRQIRSRLKKKPFPWWKTVFEKIVRLPFYCGGGEHGWKCTIDYIIRNDTNAVKILEYEETQISVKPEADRICPECGGDPEWREEAVPGQLWKCGKCGGKGKI